MGEACFLLEADGDEVLGGLDEEDSESWLAVCLRTSWLDEAEVLDEAGERGRFLLFLSV